MCDDQSKQKSISITDRKGQLQPLNRFLDEDYIWQSDCGKYGPNIHTYMYMYQIWRISESSPVLSQDSVYIKHGHMCSFQCSMGKEWAWVEFIVLHAKNGTVITFEWVLEPRLYWPILFCECFYSYNLHFETKSTFSVILLSCRILQKPGF